MSSNLDGFAVKFFMYTRPPERMMSGLCYASVQQHSFLLKTSKGKDEVFFPREFASAIPEKHVNKFELLFLQSNKTYKSLTLEATHSGSNFGGDSEFKTFVSELKRLFLREKEARVCQSAPASRNCVSRIQPVMGSAERLKTSFTQNYGTPTSSRSVSRISGNHVLRAVPKNNSPVTVQKSLTQIANESPTCQFNVPKPHHTYREYSAERLSYTRHSSVMSSVPANPIGVSEHALKSRKSAFSQKTASTSCSNDEDMQIEVVQIDEDEECSSSTVSEKSHKSLRNIGNSCYSNAVLQVLACLDRFKREILEAGIEDESSGSLRSHEDKEFLKCLACILKRLSCQSKRKHVYPKVLHEFRVLCGKKLGEQFGTDDQQDASEFFNTLLEYLQGTELPNNNPADLFRIENNQMICCKCGAIRNKSEMENMLTVSTGKHRKPSMQNVIEHFYEEEEVQIDCDSCKMKSRLAGRFVSIKRLPKYLAVSVRRYDFKNDSVEKVNSNIHINRNLLLKKLCYEAKAAEKSEFYRSIREDSESSRKLRGAQPSVEPMEALLNFSQKGGAPIGSYLDEDYIYNPRKRRADDLISAYGPSSSTRSSPARRRPPTRNESLSSEPRILEVDKTLQKKLILFYPLKTEVIQDMQMISRQKPSPLYIEKDIDDWKHHNLYRSCMTQLDLEPHKRYVDGDGNCLFRSLSWWIFCGNENGHKRLRNRICDFIMEHPSHFSGLLTSMETIEDHVDKMRQDGHWGTNVELSAAATLFNVVIFTFYESWKMFRPLFRMENGVFCERLKPNDEQINDLVQARGSIYIHNESNSHFSPVYAPKVRIEGEKTSIDIEEFTVASEKAMVKSKIIESPSRIVPCKYPVLEKFAEEEAAQYVDSIESSMIFGKERTTSTTKSTARTEEDEEQMEMDIELEIPRHVNDVDNSVYSLVGIVSHHGPNVHSGHYTGFCYDNQLGVWLHCNDEIVREVDEKTVLHESARSGYLFFYERRRHGDWKSFPMRKNDRMQLLK